MAWRPPLIGSDYIVGFGGPIKFAETSGRHLIEGSGSFPLKATEGTEGVVSSEGGHRLNASGRLGRNSCKPGIDFTPRMAPYI